jgi:uncharacterized membrane protein
LAKPIRFHVLCVTKYFQSMQHFILFRAKEPLAIEPASGRATNGRGLRALVALTVLGLCLVLARWWLTGNVWFLVMLTWNGVLAWFPLGVVLVLHDLIAAQRIGRVGVWLGLGVWLAFLPNAPYIITDLFHIQHITAPLLWFDTLSIFLFATMGLLTGLYSTLLAHRLLTQLVTIRLPFLGTSLVWAMVLGAQALAGFGIYLGRWGRWNSWHVLTKPWVLGQAVFESLHTPLAIKMTLVYGFVLAGLYVAFWLFVQDTNARNTTITNKESHD